MRVVIVRHGKAKSDSESGRDIDRDLRGRGERQAKFLGEQLALCEPPVAAIVASRATRTRRTAEIIGAHLKVEVAFDDRLLMDEPVSPVLDLIGEHRGAGCAVLVGHNPQCEQLVAVLTGKPFSSNSHFRTGEAVILEIDPDEPLESGAELDRMRLHEGTS